MNTKEQAIFKQVCRCKSGNHYDVAYAFYLIHQSKFMTTYRGKTPIWYSRECINDDWTEISDLKIRRMLSEAFVKNFTDVSKSLFTKGVDECDEWYINTALKLFNISINLKKTNYKNNILKELFNLFAFRV